MNLRELRNKIDRIDKTIVKLINERTKLVVQIGRLKAKKKTGVYVPNREREVYNRVTRLNKGPLPSKALKAIYREIMSGALSLEKSLKVAYLGPQATYTHLASLEKFGSSVEQIACNSIPDVFAEVERGRCDYGVVPIENSTEGMISHTLDMFIESDLKICSEIIIEISHNLLANCRMDEIRKVYSNPQVFGQCRLWLEGNLSGRELIEVSSTTKAAQLASSERNAAAIASELAGKRYKLKVLARSIEDSPHNITRFMVIGKTIVKPTHRDKTSIMFSIKDRVGALHAMLTPFKKNGINLTKIESRPSRRKAWDYYFFVDLEGHCEDKKVAKALEQLEKECQHLKVLGSYPKGE